MAISPILSVAQRALVASETALEVLSNNIANVNTPGYTRQRAVFTSDPPVANGTGLLVGTGARVEQVQQVADALLDRRLVRSETDRQQQAARRDLLEGLAAVVNDVQEPALTSDVSAFFDAADALARNPGGLAERQTLLGRAIALTSELNRRANGLATLQRDADDNVVNRVGRINDALQKIADLNVAISGAELGGQKANDLRDQRQRVLTELSGYLGVSATESPSGTLSVSVPGGITLVQGGTVVYTVATAPGSAGLDGTQLHDLRLQDAAGNLLDVPGVFAGGEVAGIISVRDGELVAARTGLDTVATNLRDQVNAVQTAGFDLDGNSTALVPLFGGTNAADLTVLLDPAADPNAPRLVAAAQSADPSDNTNALALADLRTSSFAALGNTTFNGYLASEQGRIGEDAARAGDVARATELLQNQLANQRAALSGVNLNEELTDLIKFQRAFQAAAQLISSTNHLLDDLVSIIR
jgi:flagellar hook-associated protein 1 FlgK